MYIDYVRKLGKVNNYNDIELKFYTFLSKQASKKCITIFANKKSLQLSNTKILYFIIFNIIVDQS